MSESTNKKIHKLQIYKETYDIDVKKDLNESDPSSVAYVHNRTHYLNNPLVITLPYKNFKSEWIYSFTFDSPLAPEEDYVIQFELINNTGALVSKIFQCGDSSYRLPFSYLNTTTKDEEDLELVIETNAITLDISKASDQLKAQLEAEPLKINIIKASDIIKLPNAYLNIAFAQTEDDKKNEALLATKAYIDTLNDTLESKHDADVTKLIAAVHSIAKVEPIDNSDDSGILCINPYDVIPKT